jgi:hypothetical protein
VASVANVLIRHLHAGYTTSHFYVGDVVVPPENDASAINASASGPSSGIAVSQRVRDAGAAEPTDPA